MGDMGQIFDSALPADTAAVVSVGLGDLVCVLAARVKVGASHADIICRAATINCNRDRFIIPGISHSMLVSVSIGCNLQQVGSVVVVAIVVVVVGAGVVTLTGLPTNR